MSIQSQLEAIARRAMQDVSKVARTSIIRIGNRVVTASPVDKGAFRNQWNTSISTISYDTSKPDDSNGQGAMTELRETVGDLQLGAVAYFNNPMPYGKRLEYDGWSEQAPNGMVRVNAALWSQIVKEEVEKLR